MYSLRSHALPSTDSLCVCWIWGKVQFICWPSSFRRQRLSISTATAIPGKLLILIFRFANDPGCDLWKHCDVSSLTQRRKISFTGILPADGHVYIVRMPLNITVWQSTSKRSDMSDKPCVSAYGSQLDPNLRPVDVAVSRVREETLIPIQPKNSPCTTEHGVLCCFSIKRGTGDTLQVPKMHKASRVSVIYIMCIFFFSLQGCQLHCGKCSVWASGRPRPQTWSCDQEKPSGYQVTNLKIQG